MVSNRTGESLRRIENDFLSVVRKLSATRLLTMLWCAVCLLGISAGVKGCIALLTQDPFDEPFPIEIEELEENSKVERHHVRIEGCYALYNHARTRKIRNSFSHAKKYPLEYEYYVPLVSEAALQRYATRIKNGDLNAQLEVRLIWRGKSLPTSVDKESQVYQGILISKSLESEWNNSMATRLSQPNSRTQIAFVKPYLLVAKSYTTTGRSMPSAVAKGFVYVGIATLLIGFVGAIMSYFVIGPIFLDTMANVETVNLPEHDQAEN